MTARTTTAEGVNELQLALASDDAFESWHRQTLPRVYSYLLARCSGDVSLAEELTQQTFIAAIDRRSTFDGRSDVVTWLCGIARHKLADHFRALERDERRRMRIEIRQLELIQGARIETTIEDRALIADVLRSLPATQRAALALIVLDDLSVSDAAALLGKSPKATESLLFRARESFRRAYGERTGS